MSDDPDRPSRNRGSELAHAAAGLVGTPFRLHGRDTTTGLDCIGLLSVALRAIGADTDLPNNYTARATRIEGLYRLASIAGFRAACHPVQAGDVLMVRPSACQHHVVIALDGNSVVHAHAGLGRVVVGTRPLAWLITGHFRLLEPEA